MKSNEPFNLANYFFDAVKDGEAGRRTAIEFGERRVSYEALRREIEEWAGRLSGWGVGPGDRVALALYDSPEWVALFLGAVSLGAIAVPISTFLPRDGIEFILRDANIRLITTESEIVEKISEGQGESAAGEGREAIKAMFAGCDVVVIDTPTRAVRPVAVEGRGADEEAGSARVWPAETTRETPAFMLYTSGSTGTPKGALHMHGAIPVTVENYSENILRLTPEDRVYSASRLFFAYGLGNSLSFPLAAGATVILDSARPTPASVAEIFRLKRPTAFFGVPALYAALLEFHRQGDRLDTSSLRLCVSAGEALPAPVFEEWRKAFGLEILDGIGSTEMLHIFISNRPGRARAGSTGQLVEGYEARLLDDQGEEAAHGEPGNLWVRGASAFAGYWGRDELTRETIREGWVRTGDVYRRDEEGFYYHAGRSDDCFKVRGLWVSPVEVESALLEHPAIVEAAVVAAVDEQGLATSRACVVIREGVGSEGLLADIRAFLGPRLPAYKIPSQIEFIEALPRTATGKVQRFRLRSASRQTPGGPDE